MGFLDWFLGRKAEDIVKSPDDEANAIILEEDDYWAIIEESLEYKDDQEEQLSFLEEAVEALSPKEIVSFQAITDKFFLQSYRADLWCAAYVIKGGCGDDGFDYFRNWLISRGKVVYENALKNPDSLVDHIDSVTEFEFEEFDRICQTAFYRKLGIEMTDYIRVNKINLGISKRPELVFEWTEEDVSSIQRLCPRLFERFWGKYDQTVL